MLLSIRRIVITAESTAVFPENPEVVWDGDGVATLSVGARRPLRLSFGSASGRDGWKQTKHMP